MQLLKFWEKDKKLAFYFERYTNTILVSTNNFTVDFKRFLIVLTHEIRIVYVSESNTDENRLLC